MLATVQLLNLGLIHNLKNIMAVAIKKKLNKITQFRQLTYLKAITFKIYD